MPREYGRNKRVADQVQRELAVILQREQIRTGLELVTVSAVDLSPDLSFARVYVTSLDTAPGREEVVATLNESAGHFRWMLSKKLTMRSVPRLKFVYDESLERGNRVAALIDEVTKHERD